MSYALCIWDPARHAPLPTSAKEAMATLERLREVSDTENAALVGFGAALAEHADSNRMEFWGCDPVATTRMCRSAVYRLAIPHEECDPQIAIAVEAAGRGGLVVVDDELGICFLPDGTIFPESSRKMWATALELMRAEQLDPNAPHEDNRTLLQKVASELFDALGRGNKRI